MGTRAGLSPGEDEQCPALADALNDCTTLSVTARICAELTSSGCLLCDTCGIVLEPPACQQGGAHGEP